MTYICKICNCTFARQCGLSKHVQTKHNMSSKDYYDLYYKKPDEGKCLTCNKPTNFINIARGYYDFCSNYCIGKNKDIQNKKKITTREHFGVDWPSQSKEVQNNIIESLESNYGVKNAFNIGLEKSIVNSHTEEANLKRGQSIHNTKQELFKNDAYKQKVIENYIKNNKQKYGTEWTSNLNVVRQKISDTVKSEDCQEKTKQTSLEKYNVPHHTQSRHYIENAKKKYLYNNVYFDSSWELALYIYAIDNKIPIIREPCTLSYIDDNNKKRYYIPDFLFNNELVEIKGDQFFDNNNNLINMYTKKIEIAKLKCINDNNVKLLRYTDIKYAIDYCIDKYNSNIWYKLFKKL